jgi:hypothetical protein
LGREQRCEQRFAQPGKSFGEREAWCAAARPGTVIRGSMSAVLAFSGFVTFAGCGVCHSLEEPAPSVSFTQAFASTAYRPRPETHVGLDSLLMELKMCNFEAEPHRCGMLSAVFDGGPVVEEAFPSSMPTFY